MRQQLTFDKLFPRFFTGWCLAALAETLLSPYGFATLAFVENLSLWRFAGILLATVVLLTGAALRYATEVPETRLLTGAAFAYLFVLALGEHNFWFSLGLVTVMLFVGIWALWHDRLRLSAWQPSRRTVIALIAAAAGIFFLYTAAVTVFRYLGYISSTFDLGIFSQMFHYMKTTGLPLTTCERDKLLSHFAVHISPIWYLLLPGYMLFPSPVYLQIMQALVLASAVIPLYLLLRHEQLSLRTVLALCLCFLSFPALTGGCFYDIHENCFLTPLLLWMFYFYEARRTVPLYVFAVLTLLVKEDAAIYVAAFALYLLCSRREYRHGAALLCLSVAYFFFAASLLSQYGEGVMTASRFGAYLPGGEGGMLTVVKTVLSDPGFLFSQVFQVNKVPFLLLMLLPLLFLPLCSKRISQLLLLIPLLVVNVMPNWEYQYSIYFQYVFGSTALLFYLAVRNLKALPAAARRIVLPLAVCCSVLLATAGLSGYADTVSGYFANRQVNTTVAAALRQIPREASVKATGYYLPAVSDRRIVYDFNGEGTAEYIVLDLRPYRENIENALAELQAQPERYAPIVYEEEIIAVFHDLAYIP